MRRNPLTRNLSTTTLLAAAAFGLAAGAHLSPAKHELRAGAPPLLAQDPILQSRALADITERALESVVSIRATRRRPGSAPPASPLFPFLPPSAPAPAMGTGSGVIVDEGGRVVTNHHVVADADEIEVQLADGSTVSATLVGSDAATDIAVLQLTSPPPLRAIRLGDSTRLRPGELVLAIGNPFGLTGSASLGIVSATGRANMGITDYEDFIQTDAAINPGNSGGALVNMHGQLVGINTAIFSRSGGSQGIGFAIPSNMVEEITDALVNDGAVRRGWLGVSIRDVGDKARTELDAPDLRGVEIRGIEAGTPAAESDLITGDVVIALDREPVVDSASFRQRIARAGVGTTVTLQVLRGGQARDVDVRLGERPDLSSARRRR